MLWLDRMSPAGRLRTTLVSAAGLGSHPACSTSLRWSMHTRHLRDLSDEGSDTPDDLAAQRRAAQTEVHGYLFAFAAPSAGAGPLITHVHVTPFTQADAGQVVWPTLVCSDL